jgi:hypothetical protein
MEKKFAVTYSFTLKEELDDFESYAKMWNKAVQTVPKPVEKRGSKTKLLHEKTREYLKEHADVKYKDALKIVGGELKKLNSNNIEK